MAGEGILRIGATVDKTGVEAGLADIQSGVKEAVQSVAVQVEETTARTRAAWNKLGADVKTAAQSVSAESLRVAEATKAQTAALADLRRASVLTRDTKLDEAASTAILAAAQQKAAAASAGVAAAKQAEAEAVAAANSKEVVSENMLVAAFERASLGIRESLTGVQEKLIATAETGKLSAAGMAGGFAGLGSLLGAGIAVGFAASYVDELAKMNVELDHLAIQTGIDITSLAGLQQIVKEMGSDWEPIATGLARMNKNLNDAVPPSKQLTEALAGINIKVEDLKGLSPEEKLQKISTAFADTSNSANRTAAAYALFGRGGVALVPILAEQGSQLEANIKKTGALTGVTEESATAARRWTQDVARLSAQFRSVMIPVMEHAEDVIRGIIGVFDSAAFVLVSGFEFVATAIVAAGAQLAKFGVLLGDVLTGNWGAVKKDAQDMASAFSGAWKQGFDEIKKNWQVVAHDFTYSTPVPKFQPGDFEGDTAPGDKEKKGRGGVLDADLEALNALKLDHEVTLEEEISFWQGRLAVAKKGTEQYKAILARLAPLMQREMKKPQDKGEQRSVDMSGVMIPDEVLNAAVKANNDAIKQTLEADRFAAEEKMRIADEEYRDVEQNSAFEVQMGRMTAAQRIRVLRQAAATERQIQQQQSQFVQMLDMNDARRYMQDLRRHEQMTRESARRITQLNQQAALDFKNKWNQAMQSFNMGFRRVIGETMTGTKSIGQAFAQMFNGIVIDLADMVAQWLLKEAEKWAMLKLMQVVGLTTHHANVVAANDATIISDAAAASATAMAANAAGGPIAMAAAGAEAMALVMSNLAMASFAAGGVVQGGGGMAVPILAHAGERVLSQSQTENFHKLVNQTTNSPSSSSKLEMHLQQNINAYDRSGMRNTLRSHADDLMDIVQDGIRSGKLKYA